MFKKTIPEKTTIVGEKEAPWWQTPSAPRMEVRKRMLPTLLFVIPIAIVAYLLLNSASQNPGRENIYYDTGAVLYPPSLPALSAGCTGIANIPVEDVQEIGKLPEGKPYTSERLPPVNGNFSAELYDGPPFANNQSENKVELSLAKSVHLLYRGYMVIWFKSNIAPEEKELIRSFVNSQNRNDRIVAAQWPVSETQNLGTSRPIFFLAWNKQQSCHEFGILAAQSFRETIPPSAAPGGTLPFSLPPPTARKSAFDDTPTISIRKTR